MTGELTSGRSMPPRWAATDRRPRRVADLPPLPPVDDGPDRAMEVLVIAQRTAEEHIRSTRAEAEDIRAQALSSAGEIVRDAEAHAQDLRRKAERVLAEANASADSIARRAQERAEEMERAAMTIVSDARDRADRIGNDARVGADELRRQAKEEYDSVLDRLQANRESLLHQIESLELFDRDFRGRLLGFMQNHIRALLAEDPQLAGEQVEYRQI
jgi:hypothetical protein